MPLTNSVGLITSTQQIFPSLQSLSTKTVLCRTQSKFSYSVNCQLKKRDDRQWESWIAPACDAIIAWHKFLIVPDENENAIGSNRPPQQERSKLAPRF